MSDYVVTERLDGHTRPVMRFCACLYCSCSLSFAAFSCASASLGSTLRLRASKSCN
jgi:hypothetical protein